MGTRDTYQKVLQRACDIAGDQAALARLLSVPEDRLAEWLHGDKEPPTSIFLRAVDIVLHEDKPS